MKKLFLVLVLCTTVVSIWATSTKIVDKMSYSSYESYRVTAETESDRNGRSFTIDLIVEGTIGYSNSYISKVTYGNETISYYRDMISGNYYVYVQGKKFYFRF